MSRRVNERSEKSVKLLSANEAYTNSLLECDFYGANEGLLNEMLSIIVAYLVNLISRRKHSDSYFVSGLTTSQTSCKLI